ncbi:PTS sugar transporter subunit IIB [Clostridium frigidicarnis]|uniref:PTS system IIB component, L-Asc family n=1 Tax=Clostridium frigidicarnis TaxID=84698 RepID=A0A1I0ZTF1_9CLOT|nr:PTS sugar transporter subunit IIB [Clostridium frigidicarnis]SFB28994.1 PTS system IIB component, L-Asc family [Clostridium frigidicarnis]
MKRIMAVCGSGLGSSFMVEMNITDILNELGVSGDYEANHTSLADVTSGDADIFVTAKDLEDSASHLPNLIVLDSLLDKNELREKLKEKLAL